MKKKLIITKINNIHTIPNSRGVVPRIGGFLGKSRKVYFIHSNI